KKIKAETERFSPDCLPVFPPASMQFEMNLPPHIAQVEIEPKPNVDDLQSLFKEGRLICKRCGKCHGHVFDHAKKVLETKVLKERPDLMNEIASRAIKTQKDVCVKVAFPIDRLELQYKGSTYPLEKMTIHLHAFLSSGKMAFKTYEIEGESLPCKSIQYGEVILGNKAVKMVLPEGLSSKQIVVDIHDTQNHD
ncbi:MAG: hypothetical protein SVV80_09150, partial [Planctomycetota bacterium]|nr:hypothetical protein [Planctomycetota bacterium]